MYKRVFKMTLEKDLNNFEKAKLEADKIDEEIISILELGKSFRVEAGAGSGKTYSLNNVIEWIQDNKRADYIKNNKNVICITYTNAAVDVIYERIKDKSFIIPSTIHSFAWHVIKQYQSALLNLIKTDDSLHSKEGDFNKVTSVNYTLGNRYDELGVHYLYHDDVLKLFVSLLENSKFRSIFSNKYPLILIDEYQDSYKPIIASFIKYFIDKEEGPQFGFFGDSWQTIYQSNNACGLIEHDKIYVISKVSNFRSAPRIVELLNNIRPELPQISAMDNFDGEVHVITCDDYDGVRRVERNFKGDLPTEELKTRLDKLVCLIKKLVPKEENLKALMLTHKILASQQGYDQLLKILENDLRDKQDPFLLFFMEIVEPIYKALESSDVKLLFNTLKSKRYPITKKIEKIKWKELKDNLTHAREKRSVDVLKVVIESGLIPVPPVIKDYYEMYETTPELIYQSDITLKSFLDLDYGQYISAINFLYPEAEYSTEHGVKGEEYDNVIFVMSRGWNQYQFDKYVPMIFNGIESGKESSFVRNRNLFYVSCSRPKKRLYIFVTFIVDSIFEKTLKELVGVENYHSFNDFVRLLK